MEGVTLDDLDDQTVKRTRKLFSKRQSDRKKAQETLKKLSGTEVLNKIGIAIKGTLQERLCFIWEKANPIIFLMDLYRE